MIHIIQIFKSVARIEKPNYNASSRSEIGEKQSYVSKTGFLKDHVITLPIESQHEVAIEQADLIIIQDVEGFDPFALDEACDKTSLPVWLKNSTKESILANNLRLKAFRGLARLCAFEIFQFRKTSNDFIEIGFHYSSNIGAPKRESHKIAELKIGESIRFKINGKDDFTMSGRRQRTFSEFDYVIEYLGIADRIEYSELNKIEVVKDVPLGNSKLIDERKILN